MAPMHGKKNYLTRQTVETIFGKNVFGVYGDFSNCVHVPTVNMEGGRINNLYCS